MKMNQKDFVVIHVLMASVIIMAVAFLAFTLGCFVTARHYYDCNSFSDKDYSRGMAPLSCYKTQDTPDYRKIYQGVPLA